jgi:hypothetical protein
MKGILMPLEDLTDLGYTIARPPEDETMATMASTVWGHDKQWWVEEGGDEEAIVLEATNYAALLEKLEQAQDYFRDNYNNWATMTAPQKDAAARNAQRALAKLIKHVRNDLTDEGV